MNRRPARAWAIYLIVIATLLACRLGLAPPPTPGAFPIQGVEQITEDYAFYEALEWSPAGGLLSATRCLLQNSQPFCLTEGVAVSIDLANHDANPIDLSGFTPNWTTSSPVAWSPDGAQLLLYVLQGPGVDPAPLSQTIAHYITYSPNDASVNALEVDVQGAVLGWGGGRPDLLVLRDLSEGQFVIGWLTLSTGNFESETVIPDDFAPLQQTTAISTNAALILSGDTPYASNCENILAYRIGSGDSFSTYIEQACFPAFSHDGSKLAYVAKVVPEAWPTRLMIADADGSNATPLFVQDLPKIITYPTWSPDGSRIAFTYPGEAGANAVYVAEIPQALRPSGSP